VKLPASNRVLGGALACAVAVSAAGLFVGSGSAVESPLVTAPVVDALPGVDQPLILVAQADAAPADKPVSYTEEQADRGKKRFDGDCVDCHGEDLRGGLNGGPPLRGLTFESKYAEGAPASGMFIFMSTLMPPNDPGRYSPGVYADLMAYILKMNGFQPGSEPLPSDVDALDHMIVEK
jgi:mono/diheme cytochrome c family protein